MMNVKDLFKISFTSIIRNNKNRFYFIIMMFCSLITIIILFFGTNFLNILNNDMKNQTSYRTFNVYPEYDWEELNNFDRIEKNKKLEELRETAIEQLKTINHVSLVVKTEYDHFFVETNDFKVPGRVTLLYAKEENLPEIVVGKGFKNGASGVAVCPVNFLPFSINSDNLGVLGIPLIKKTDLLTIDDLLKTKFIANYDEYEVKGHGDITIVDNHTKEYKIIGLYNNAGTMNPNNECYVPGDDIIEMCHTSNFICNENQEQTSITVIIDEYKNMDYFKEKVKTMGFSVLEVNVYSENTLNSTVEIGLLILILLILITVVIITLSYIKKKVLNETKIIGVLRACGYNKKQIKNIYLLESTILNILSYLFSLLLFQIIYQILKKKYMLGLILRGIYIKNNYFVFIYSFSIIVIFSFLIANLNLNQKLKSDIISLIGSSD